MQAKEILYDEKARLKIKEGVDAVANAVKTTLGPRGRNVILEQPINPIVTNDGVTIAREIILKDKFANLGASLVKEAAIKTNDDAGDGTTTAALLVQKMVQEGYKFIQTGMNPMIMKKGMVKALDKTVEILKQTATPVDSKQQKQQIATISANNDEDIGKLIADIMEEVGPKGVVTIKRAEEPGLSKEIVKGMKIDSGIVSGFMFTNPEKLRSEARNIRIILTTEEITSQNQLLPIVEKMVNAGIKEFVIIAKAIEQEALIFLIKNGVQGKFRGYGIKAPSFGDYQVDLLTDIGAVIEANVIGPDTGTKIEDMEIDDLGFCEIFTSDKDRTILTNGKGDVKARIKGLEKILEEEKDSYRKEKIKDRIGTLSGGVGVVNVGAYSETEQQEMQYRIEDALLATKAAIEEGIVAGGGKALLMANLILDETKIKDEEEKAGYLIVKKALLEPIRQIAVNAGVSADRVIDKVQNGEPNLGWDAKEDRFVNMLTEGIIDPLKVVRNALENATSTAAIILTTNTCITTVEEESKKSK